MGQSEPSGWVARGGRRGCIASGIASSRSSANANYAYDMDAIKKAAKAKAMSMGVDAMKNPEVQKKVKEVVIDQVKKDPKAAMEAGKKIMKEAMKK